MPIADVLADDITERTIALARVSAGWRREVLGILRDAEQEIVATLSRDDLTAVRRDRLQQQLEQIRSLVRDGYAKIDSVMRVHLERLAIDEADWHREVINTAAGIDIMQAMPTEQQLTAMASSVMIQGAPNAEWWARQAQSAQFALTSSVRAGLAQGETNQVIVQRLRSQMAIQRNHAAAQVQTAVQTVAVEARDMTLRENADIVRGKTQVSTLDSRTTFLCASRDGASYALDNEPLTPKTPPYIALPAHWNCRSTYIPVLKSWRELGIPLDDIPQTTRASMDGQVPASTTFADFLDRKGADWQDRYLGHGRAQLWRDGKITLADLVDATGRELTLDELRALRRS